MSWPTTPQPGLCTNERASSPQATAARTRVTLSRSRSRWASCSTTVPADTKGETCAPGTWSGAPGQPVDELARAADDEGVLGRHLGLWNRVGEVLARGFHADDRYAVLAANLALRQREADRLAWRGHLDDGVAVVELDVVLQLAVDQVCHPSARVVLGLDDVVHPDPLQDAGVLEADRRGPDGRYPRVGEDDPGQPSGVAVGQGLVLLDGDDLVPETVQLKSSLGAESAEPDHQDVVFVQAVLGHCVLLKVAGRSGRPHARPIRRRGCS